jgi:hypothetical protein
MAFRLVGDMMAIRSLALASGVTSLADHRLTLGAFQAPGASVLERRQGLSYYPGAGDLVGTGALTATVSPFVAVVDGTSNSLQGSYVIVSDAATTITFDEGEPGTIRRDRVILRIRDDTYDGSGSTDADIVYLKGDETTGDETGLPPSSLLLWEVDVPIAASAITFSSARLDRREWTGTSMRIPVNSSTERDALPEIPGLEVTRLDTGDIEQFWDGGWRNPFPQPEVPETPPNSVQFVRKTADTSRTSTTETADPHLVLPMEANSVYFVTLIVIYTAAAGGHLLHGLTGPAGCSIRVGRFFFDNDINSGYKSVTAFYSDTGNILRAGSSGSGTPLSGTIQGIVQTGGTAGNLAWSWGVWTTGTTQVRADSFLRLEKVG